MGDEWAAEIEAAVWRDGERWFAEQAREQDEDPEPEPEPVTP